MQEPGEGTVPEQDDAPVPVDSVAVPVSAEEYKVQRRVDVWSSPFPPPQVIRGYEDILPGAADRLITLCEDEAKHRREKVFPATIRAQLHGRWMSSIVALVTTVSYTIWGRGSLGSGVIAGLVIVPIIGSAVARYWAERKSHSTQDPSPAPYGED